MEMLAQDKTLLPGAKIAYIHSTRGAPFPSTYYTQTHTQTPAHPQL